VNNILLRVINFGSKKYTRIFRVLKPILSKTKYSISAAINIKDLQFLERSIKKYKPREFSSQELALIFNQSKGIHFDWESFYSFHSILGLWLVEEFLECEEVKLFFNIVDNKSEVKIEILKYDGKANIALAKVSLKDENEGYQNYFLKVVNHSKTNLELYRLLKEQGVSVPQFLHAIEFNGLTFEIHQFIESKTIQINSLEDFRKIIFLAVQVSKVKYEGTFLKKPNLYPKNINECFTFEECQLINTVEELIEVLNIEERFKNLPKSFNHNDFTAVNILQDNDGGIWLIDYSGGSNGVVFNDIILFMFISQESLLKNIGLDLTQSIEFALSLYQKELNFDDKIKLDSRLYFLFEGYRVGKVFVAKKDSMWQSYFKKYFLEYAVELHQELQKLKNA
jgi:thiamine kinase-like enzyme